MKKLNELFNFLTAIAALILIIVFIISKTDNENNFEEKVAEKNATHWVRIFKETFSKIEGQEKYWPKEVLSHKFLSAIEKKESDGKIDAVGKNGEVGLRQTKSIVIEDVGDYCLILKKKKIIDYPNWLDTRLDSLVVKKIKIMILSDGELSRTISNLYFSKLFYLHKVGNISYKQGNIRGARKFLAGYYNKGLGNIEKFGIEYAKEYYTEILSSL